MNDIYSLAKTIQKMDPNERENWLLSLSVNELEYIVKYVPYHLREKQMPPPGDSSKWRTLLMLAGRGFGKSEAAAWWLRYKLDQGLTSMAVIGPTIDEINSTIIKRFIEVIPPTYDVIKKGISRLIITNTLTGVVCEVDIKSPVKEIRGANWQAVVVDELIKWCDAIQEKIEERFASMEMALRKGDPQIFIATTPKPFNILKDIQARSNTITVKGTTFENNSI